jgi:hypothetical protein
VPEVRFQERMANSAPVLDAFLAGPDADTVRPLSELLLALSKSAQQRGLSIDQASTKRRSSSSALICVATVACVGKFAALAPC